MADHEIPAGPDFDWMEHYPASVTVCDTRGTIIAMNRQAMANFARRGGQALIGTSLFACHPEAANDSIRTLLREQRSNSYYTVKNGIRRLVHQEPWYHRDTFGGLVETVIVLPAELPTKHRS